MNYQGHNFKNSVNAWSIPQSLIDPEVSIVLAGSLHTISLDWARYLWQCSDRIRQSKYYLQLTFFSCSSTVLGTVLSED